MIRIDLEEEDEADMMVKGNSPTVITEYLALTVILLKECGIQEEIKTMIDCFSNYSLEDLDKLTKGELTKKFTEFLKEKKND